MTYELYLEDDAGVVRVILVQDGRIVSVTRVTDGSQ